MQNILREIEEAPQDKVGYDDITHHSTEDESPVQSIEDSPSLHLDHYRRSDPDRWYCCV